MAAPWGISRERSVWWAIGGALAVVLAFVIWSFVGTFVFGVFVYYATRPLHRRLKRRIRPPSLAAAVSLLGLALPAILLLAYTLAIGVQELTRLSKRTDLGAIDPYIAPYLGVSRIPKTPEELLADGGIDAIGGILASATTYIGFVGAAALHLFVMIAIAFYLLRDDHRLSRWVRRRFGDDAGVFEAYVDGVDRSFHQIFFGNILNAALTGTIGAVAYNALGVFSPAGISLPYPTLLGLLAGVASLIPLVGMKLVYVPATAYLLGIVFLGTQPRLAWFPVAFGVLSFVVVDTIPDLVLRPYVSGRELHVGMVMLAYIFGPLLFGWYGVFLGPMLLVFIVQFVRLVLPELVTGVPIRPVAVDPSHLTEPDPTAGFDASAQPENADAPSEEIRRDPGDD